MIRLLMPPLLLALAGCACAALEPRQHLRHLPGKAGLARRRPQGAEEMGRAVPIPMAMMYQESSFKRDAVPPLLLPGPHSLAGCAPAPPSNPDNICAIFREKPDWHDAALKVQKKWGACPFPWP